MIRWYDPPEMEAIQGFCVYSRQVEPIQGFCMYSRQVGGHDSHQCRFYLEYFGRIKGACQLLAGRRMVCQSSPAFPT